MVKKNILLALIVVSSFCLKAQQSTQLGAFDFLPQSVYANPARMPLAKVNVGIPGISQLHFNHSNNFFVPNRYLETTSTGNTRINPKRIIDEMGEFAFVRQELDIELFHVGIRIKQHYAYASIRERIQFGINLPVDIFNLGVYGNMNSEVFDNNTVHLTGLGVNGIHFREYTLGYNFGIEEKWRFGGAVKYLYGMENIHSAKSNLQLRTDPHTYDMYLNGGVEVRTAGLVEKDGKMIHEDIKNYLLNLNNHGVAINVGGIYKHNEKLILEFSAHDIGFIKWQNNIANYGTNDANFKFEGVDLTDFIFVKGDDFGDAFDNKVDSLLNAFKGIYDLEQSEESYNTFLNGYLRYGGSYILLPSEKFAGKAWFNIYHGLHSKYIPFTATLGYTQNVGKTIQAGVQFSKKHRLPVAIGFGGVLNAGPIQFHLLVENINLFRFYQVKMVDDRDSNKMSSFPYFRDPRQLHFIFGMNVSVGKKERKN